MFAASLAIDWKKQWLAHHGFISAAFADPLWLDVLKALCQSADTGAVVSRLALDGAPIAIEIGFRHKGRHYAFLGTCHPDHMASSPVKIALEEVIVSCLEAGIKVFDMLPPADDYKHEWTNTRVAVSDYILPVSWFGAVYARWWEMMLKPRAKRLAKALLRFAPKALSERFTG